MPLNHYNINRRGTWPKFEASSDAKLCEIKVEALRQMQEVGSGSDDLLQDTFPCARSWTLR